MKVNTNGTLVNTGILGFYAIGSILSGTMLSKTTKSDEGLFKVSYVLKSIIKQVEF